MVYDSNDGSDINQGRIRFVIRFLWSLRHCVDTAENFQTEELQTKIFFKNISTALLKVDSSSQTFIGGGLQENFPFSEEQS